MTPCVLVAELGANPAALAQALWALPRHHDTAVREAFVLTSARGRVWLDRELLAPGAALDQLRAVLGDAVPSRERIHVHVAPCEDEIAPGDADTWNDSRWQHATAAIRAAGETPVVFALAAGRRRTSAAITTVMFQLLARQRDRLVDVRIGDRRVEGARAGFYFPEQPRQALHVEGDAVAARSVAVHLVELRVPRLRRLLAGKALATWSDALAAGQRVIEEVPAVELAFDLAAGSVVLNGSPIKFQEAEFIWLATLAAARANDVEGWVWGDDYAPVLAVLAAMRDAREPGWLPAAIPWKNLLKGEKVLDGSLRKLRSATASRLRAALTGSVSREAARRFALQFEVFTVAGPSPKKRSRWRLPIAADAITLTGLAK